MEKLYDAAALGEVLIDFTPCGLSETGNPLFEANPGGAPGNVLSMLQKLGRKTAFLGKVGKDQFGIMLRMALQEQGIDTTGLREDPEVHTTLAFVHKLPDGDRDFSFYRNPGADMNLREDELDLDIIRQAKVFHFGSLSLTDEPVRKATVRALTVAQEARCLITYDPNLREPLWHSEEEARRQVRFGLSQADAVKISDNEILWLTGKNSYDEGIEQIREEFPNLKLVLLSMGPDGSRAYYRDIRVEQPAFLQDSTIETTGAGDTFCAVMIDYLLAHSIDQLTADNLQELLIYANAAASIVTTRRGALRVMPRQEEIIAFLAERMPG